MARGKTMQKELHNKIRELAKKRNAIILAHNYQLPEVQDVADLAGDSLGLSVLAGKTPADVIVFCGVHFMAETASILCPKKKVLLPRPDAGCYMANLINAKQLKARKKELPGVPVVTYVNSTAEVKAESDICCTSANAVAVVKSLKAKRVLMTPDRNLALYTARHVKADIITWDGCCNVHDNLRADQVLKVKKRHPKALVVAHPECRPEIIDIADAVRSTSGMLDFCMQSKADAFIIATENGILHQLRRQTPKKKFYQASRTMLCPDMKLTTLTDVYHALDTLKPEVKVPENIRRRAIKAVNRMLAVPRD
jgi:quinolinate synthase